MSQPSIKLVCFDLGGVLIRICRSWEEGCRAAGLPVRSNGAAQNDGRGWCAPPELTNLHQTGRITCAEFVRRFSAAVNNLYSPDEIMRVHQAWMLGEYEGVGPVIDQIHAAGLATACLSNTNHAHWSRMGEFPAVMKLHHRLASHEMGLHKPDPAIFHEFERRMGFSGGQILYFDDLTENVHAASRCEWQAVCVDPLSPTAIQIATALKGSL